MSIVKMATVQELTDLLRRFGLNPDLFGSEAAKTVEALFEEIQSGESELIIENGHLARKIGLILIGIVYRYGSRNLRLREDRIVFNDGRIRQRHDILGLMAISEKLKKGEDPEQGLKRAIKEELGIKYGYYIIARGQSEEEKISQSYPGLSTISPTYWFEVELDMAMFNPEGYVEKQKDKTTYWVWQREF
jgi:hypothetical protein